MRNKIQASTKGRIFSPPECPFLLLAAGNRQDPQVIHTRCPASESPVVASHWAIIWWAICRRGQELGYSSMCPTPHRGWLCTVAQPDSCCQLTLASQIPVCSLMPVPERRTRHPSIPNSAFILLFPSCATVLCTPVRLSRHRYTSPADLTLGPSGSLWGHATLSEGWCRTSTPAHQLCGVSYRYRLAMACSVPSFTIPAHNTSRYPLPGIRPSETFGRHCSSRSRPAGCSPAQRRAEKQ